MKKILFISTFSIFFFLGNSVSAQSVTKSDCEAMNGGTGICNTFTADCQDNQTKVGMCTFGPATLGACCLPKDNGPVDSTSEGVDLDDAQDKSVPIIGAEKCNAPKSAGGWGGTCKGGGLIDPLNPFTDADYCDDSGNDAEDFVGFCQPSSLGGIEQVRKDCCVQKGTAIKDPTPDKFVTTFTTEDTCENEFSPDGTGYGGSCEDIDSSLDPTGGWIDGKEPTCDDPSQIVAALCEGSDDGGDAFNGCCVKKDGDYCKKLATDNGGTDVCSSAAAAGPALGIGYSDYQLLERIPGSSNTSGLLQPYIESLYKAGFVLIVLGAVIMIGFGGFTYMASAGNTSMIKKGKGMITDAIIGLVVALLIYLILNIINPDLVNLKLDPLPGLDFDSSGIGATTAEQNSANETTAAEQNKGGGSNCPAAPANAMETFPASATSGPAEKATPTTVKSFLAMREAALKDGIDIKVTDGHRAETEQVSLWNDRASIGQVAKPCSLGGGGSNHNSGVALDLSHPWLPQDR